MGHSFFIWKDIDCRSMGIVMQGPAAIVRPEERIRHVEIPGKSGDLTETEGDNIFNSYIQTVTITVRGGYRVREIYKWLRGSGYVIFSGEPDRKQQARIVGAVTLNRTSRNLDTWAGEVQFYCQPLKERLTERTVTVTSSGTQVRNNGDVLCRPMYKVTASESSVTLAAAGDGTPDANSITVTGLSSGTVIWIDAEEMEVWNAGKTATLTQNSTGAFPVMGIGWNSLTFSGCSSIEIQKRERFL